MDKIDIHIHRYRVLTALLPLLLGGGEGEGEGEGAGESHPSFLTCRITSSISLIPCRAVCTGSGRPSGPRGKKVSSRVDWLPLSTLEFKV